MANMYASGGTVQWFVEGEGWRDLGSFTYAELVENPLPEPPMPPVDDFMLDVFEQSFTFTGTFEASPEFYGIVVGLQLQYGLRELHRDLGRYARWPHTN